MRQKKVGVKLVCLQRMNRIESKRSGKRVRFPQLQRDQPNNQKKGGHCFSLFSLINKRRWDNACCEIFFWCFIIFVSIHAKVLTTRRQKNNNTKCLFFRLLGNPLWHSIRHESKSAIFEFEPVLSSF